MLQHLLQRPGDSGEIDISTCMQTVTKRDASDTPRPERERAAAIYPTGSPFLIPSTLSWEDRPKLTAGASGAAALLTCCALHPFDLIKTRMQGNAAAREATNILSNVQTAIVKRLRTAHDDDGKGPRLPRGVIGPFTALVGGQLCSACLGFWLH